MNNQNGQCRKIIIYFVAIGLLTLFCGIESQAFYQPSDERNTSGSIGLRGSFFRSNEADKDDWMTGAQLRFHLNPALTIEGSIDYRKDQFNNGEIDVKTYPIQASLLAYLAPGNIVSPFILAGAGWYYTRVEQVSTHADETRNRFGVHAGAGLEAWLNTYWSIDGSYRYIWTKSIDVKGLSIDKEDFKDQGHQITASLNYHF